MSHKEDLARFSKEFLDAFSKIPFEYYHYYLAAYMANISDQHNASATDYTKALPMNEIAIITHHTSVESHMRKMFQLGCVSVMLQVLSKLFDHPLLLVPEKADTAHHEALRRVYMNATSLATKFSDKNESGDTYKAKATLLLGIGEVLMHPKNRKDLLHDKGGLTYAAVIPFYVSVLHRTYNTAYIICCLKLFSELTFEEQGPSRINDCGGIVLWLSDKCLPQENSYCDMPITIDGLMGDKNVVYTTYRYGLLDTSLRGIQNMVQYPELRAYFERVFNLSARIASLHAEGRSKEYQRLILDFIRKGEISKHDMDVLSQIDDQARIANTKSNVLTCACCGSE